MLRIRMMCNGLECMIKKQEVVKTQQGIPYRIIRWVTLSFDVSSLTVYLYCNASRLDSMDNSKFWWSTTPSSSWRKPRIGPSVFLFVSLVKEIAETFATWFPFCLKLTNMHVQVQQAFCLYLSPSVSYHFEC